MAISDQALRRGVEDRSARQTRRGRIWIGLIPAMLVPAISSIFYFHFFPDARISWLLYSGTKVFTVVWPIVAILAIEGVRPRLGAIDWRRHLRAVPLGLLTGAAIGGLGIALYRFTGVGAYIDAHSGAIREKVNALNLMDYYVVYVLFLSIVHSFIEEWFWRWYVFGRLARVAPMLLWRRRLACASSSGLATCTGEPPAPQQRQPILAAYAMASLAFAAHHYVILGAYFPLGGTLFFGTCVGVGGAIWCAMLRRQRSLAGAWVSHMLVDLAIFYVGYRILFGA